MIAGSVTFRGMAGNRRVPGPRHNHLALTAATKSSSHAVSDGATTSGVPFPCQKARTGRARFRSVETEIIVRPVLQERHAACEASRPAPRCRGRVWPPGFYPSPSSPSSPRNGRRLLSDRCARRAGHAGPAAALSPGRFAGRRTGRAGPGSAGQRGNGGGVCPTSDPGALIVR